MAHLSLISIAGAGILLLLFLVIYLRIAAFVALLLVSFIVGVGAGMPMDAVIQSVKQGMGGTLGFVAVVVGLGAILGQILESSGGIAQFAQSLIQRFGEAKAQWSLGFVGFIVAIPVFFDVAFIILVPLVYSLAQKSGRSLLYYAVPLLAGLAVTHAFIPPTPGPIAVAEILNADLGWVIVFGALIGIPSMILAGPLFGRYIAQKIHVSPPAHFLAQINTQNANELNHTLPISLVVTIIALPLILITANTLAPFITSSEQITAILSFIGHPFVALLLTTLLAMALANRHCQLNKNTLLEIANKGLEPAGIVILITGAGGAFKQLLIDSGVGAALGDMLAASGLPILLMAFSIAAMTRIAQGSSTVAMITAAGLIAPIASLQTLSPAFLGLMVIAISAGATTFSHVNDSGFWLVSRYLGISEKDTLKSWSVLTTIIALVGLLMAMILQAFI